MVVVDLLFVMLGDSGVVYLLVMFCVVFECVVLGEMIVFVGFG